MSIDCKAPVHIGEVSRGGRTRGDHAACDHDLGLQAKAMPCGIVEEESGQRSITFGSAYKTSDGSVDALAAWGAAWDTNAQGAMARLQSNIDTGPESRGKRTQFFQRMVGLCDAIGKPIQLRYALPYPSKDPPSERCWGILALPWNGTKFVDRETMMEWAKTMPWKGMHPLVELRRKGYQTGVTLSKQAMRVGEDRLERHPALPY